MNDSKTIANLRILQVLPSMNSGGVERGTVEIDNALIANNYYSFIAAKHGILSESLQGIFFNIPTLASKNPFKLIISIFKLVEVIKNNQIDIIHARSRMPAIAAFFAAKITNTKFITTFHGFYSFNNCIKKYYNSIMTKGCKIIAVSNSIKNHLITDYHINPNKITVIHRGVDPEKFDNINDNRIIAAKKFMGQYNKPIILLAGRISSWKGQLEFIEALSEIKNNNYMGIIIGEVKGKEKFLHRIRNTIAEFNLQENIRIIDAYYDMPAIYALCDIIVSASTRPEAFGRIAIEAQLSGKICVATSIGGSIETVIDGKTGFLVSPSRPDKMADIFTQILNMSDKEKKEISDAAIPHIKANFTTKQMQDKTLALYQELANE
jgi:glycosyltransferase involved in cell wall biosynthesis